MERQGSPGTPLFLGGPPKSGSSSIFAALVAHPDVVGTEPKETFFFMDEDYPIQRPESVHRSSLDAFLRRLPGHRSGYWVDGTTHLLFQTTAPAVLAEKFPDARIVFVLRNPADRLKSSYRYTRNNLALFTTDLPYPDYVRLVLDDDQAAVEDHLKGSTAGYVLAHDLKYGRYADYLQNWYAEFPARQIYLVNYEDYRRDAGPVLADLSEWLGLTPAVLPVGTRNVTFEVKNRRLHRLAKKWGSKLAANPVKALVKRAYLNLQRREKDTFTPLPPDLRAELTNYYAAANDRLRQDYQFEHDWDAAGRPE